jgi:NodT family efflux transporter outer membrane factor (OMF) lipoprotein
MKLKFIKSQIVVSFILCCGCSFFSEEIKAPIHPEDLPKHYSINVPRENPIMYCWTQAFKDDELNQLIARSLNKNLSLADAWTKIVQARAQAAIAGSNRWPSLSASIDPGLTKSKSSINGTSSWINDFSAGLMSSFEIDFWGKIQAQQQSAQLEFEATRLDYQTALISLISEISLCWIDIISQRMLEELLQKQLTTNTTYLKLVRLRFQKGMVSALDVYQQQQVVESIQSQLPLIKAQEKINMNTLAIFCGEPPQTVIPVHRKHLPSLGELPTSGIPADLLSNRPDIKASWNRLQAANKSLWAAKANQLPSITLTASGNFQNDDISHLFDFWFVKLAGDLVVPILDGGRRKAETNKARGLAYQRSINYRNTVYKALKEVEDTLVQEQQQHIHIKALIKEKETAQKALNEARNRYNKGLNDYLPVLTQTLTVQRLERDIIQKQAQCIRYRIQLYRALGGKPPIDRVSHDIF